MRSIMISLSRIHGRPEIFVSKALLLLFYEVRESAMHIKTLKIYTQ